jgi:hypothetical protein
MVGSSLPLYGAVFYDEAAGWANVAGRLEAQEPAVRPAAPRAWARQFSGKEFRRKMEATPGVKSRRLNPNHGGI